MKARLKFWTAIGSIFLILSGPLQAAAIEAEREGGASERLELGQLPGTNSSESSELDTTRLEAPSGINLDSNLSLEHSEIAPAETSAEGFLETQGAFSASDGKEKSSKGQAEKLGQALSAKGADPRKISDAAFAGSASQGGELQGVSVGSASAASLREANRLRRHRPTVLFIGDVFAGKISASVRRRLNILAAHGVKIVLVTSRPDKGRNSARELVVSKIKARQKNPMIIASFNGGRITAHNSSRAKNPKTLVDDLGFSEKTLPAFRKITQSVRLEMKTRQAVEQFNRSSNGTSFIYGIRLPKSADAKAWAAAYQKALKAQGLGNYAVEVSQDKGRPALLIQANDLGLNASRIEMAIEAQYPKLAASLKADDVRKLGTAAFLGDLSFTGHPKIVNSEAELDAELALILGREDMEVVKVSRSKVRAFKRYELKNSGQSWQSQTPVVRSEDQDLKGSFSLRHDLDFYTQTVLNYTMSTIQDRWYNHEFANGSLEAAQALATRAFLNPSSPDPSNPRFSLRLKKYMWVQRARPQWKKIQGAYLSKLLGWLRKYYKLKFHDNYDNEIEAFADNILDNGRWGLGDTQNLLYEDPHTGTLYNLGVGKPRSRLVKEGKKWVFHIEFDRFGRKPDRLALSRALDDVIIPARAVIETHAHIGPDGRWYANDEANPEVVVELNYPAAQIPIRLTAQEIFEHNGQTMALIEREEADAKFQKLWAKQEARNREEEERKAKPIKPRKVGKKKK